jgi:hypothetical protein
MATLGRNRGTSIWTLVFRTQTKTAELYEGRSMWGWGRGHRQEVYIVKQFWSNYIIDHLGSGSMRSSLLGLGRIAFVWEGNLVSVIRWLLPLYGGRGLEVEGWGGVYLDSYHWVIASTWEKGQFWFPSWRHLSTKLPVSEILKIF